MNVQDINNGIDSKIRETNERVDRSVEIRRNRNDKDMQERLEKFDNQYLTDKEREYIKELNEAEDKQLKESGKYAVKSVGNTVKVATGGILGKAFGTMGAADNAQRFTDSEDKLSDISTKRDAIRANAQQRYEQASGIAPKESSENSKEGDFNYGR